MNAIELQNISVTTADSIKIIDGFSLKVAEGECIVLCGESGCGKTTITRVINGLIPEFYDTLSLEGEVKHFGTVINGQTISDIAKNVGSVFQNPKSQFFNLDTSNELIFGCENLNLTRSDILARAQDTIDDLNLKELVNRSIFELSGGEKQRVACGSIISMKPKILLLDEPTANLDFESIELLKVLLSSLKKLGYTILLSEHRLYWLKELADRFIYLKFGQHQATYSFDELYEKSEQELTTMGLRSMNVPLLSKKMKELINEKSWELCQIQNKAIEDSSLSIELEEVEVYYNDKTVFRIPHLQFSGGSIIGVIGENGAGKTTFINTLLGFAKYKGAIKKNEQTLNKKVLHKQGFMVMQDVNQQLFSNTLLNEVRLGTDVTVQEVKQVLKQLGLSQLETRHPASLSGGEKQRTAIATALLSDKKIIVFDEPTSGLDRNSLEQFCNEIKALSSPNNIIFIVTHDMEMAFRLVDFVLVCTRHTK